MTMQIADAMEAHLAARGVAVVIQAKHLCMSCRGVQKHRSVMITSAMRGVFRDEGPARSEFFQLVDLASRNNQ
jgi:GTP cyclohydrolase I